MSAAIELRGLTHRYGSTTSLDALDLEVPAGSFTVLVGASGSGKSTVLSIVAGLLAADAGTVRLGGEDVTAAPVGTRDLAMVFQDYALYPHMTVAENIGFALRLDARHGRSRLTRAQRDARVAEACAGLGIGELTARRPGQLSGGQRQRVAIARAVVRRPGVLLLDEPLSAVDAAQRHRTRALLSRLHRELGTTIVLVTHDQTDALSLAQHLVLLDGGRCVQAGPPEELYRRPANVTAARFLGDVPINLRAAGGGALVGWRAHDGVLGPADGPGLELAGVVELVEYAGTGHLLHCTDREDAWTVAVGGPGPWRVGDPVRVHVPDSAVHRFDASGAARA